MTFYPGPTSPGRTQFTTSLVEFAAGVRKSFGMRTYDEFGNAIEVGGDVFQIVLRNDRTAVDVESTYTDHDDSVRAPPQHGL